MTNAAKAKKYEKQVYDYIVNNKSDLTENHSLSIVNFLSNVKINKKSVILKPKKSDFLKYNTKTSMRSLPNCRYSDYKESKSDVFFTDVSDKEFGVSIKKSLGEAYISTINNARDAEILFLGLPFSSLLTKGEKDVISKTLKGSLIKIHNFNPARGKTPKETVEHEFAKSQKYSKYLEESNRKISLEDLKSRIIEAYTIKKDYDIYCETLSLQESNVQKMFKVIFDNKDYALEFLKEMLTGNYKFNDSFPFKANYILCAEHFQLIDEEILEMYYNIFVSRKKIGRLQNVPRRGLSKKIICNVDLSNEYLVNNFSTADLSIKL
jgi:hypothetical protein